MTVQGMCGVTDYNKHNSWFAGLLIPCALVIYGIFCIIKQHAFIFSNIRFSSDYLLTVDGPYAIAVGIACIGFGIFLHCQVWTPSSMTWRFYPLGSLIGIATFVVSLIYFIVRLTLHNFS